jgi:multidrug resistance protein
VQLILVAFTCFIDIVAYSIAVPVLPDLSRRLGASATTIGLLFASFGLTVLIVSLPMGAISDRTGRRVPLVAGALALAGASALFAYGDQLPWLFAARLVQGAADAVTWVVGFALLADVYEADRRGRAMGTVLSCASLAFMIGPTLGGWLYEAGGIRLPFLTVAAGSLAAAVGFIALPMPAPSKPAAHADPLDVLRTPAVAACALAVMVLGATLGLVEPVFALFLSSRLGLGPARIGLVFGCTALANAIVNPLFGHFASRAPRHLTVAGLAAAAIVLPLLSFAFDFRSAVFFSITLSVSAALAITPSLTLMGEAVSAATGAESFGLTYGVYNFAWAAGLLVGPAAGGFLFEKIGLRKLGLLWSGLMLAAIIVVWRRSGPAQSGQRMDHV